MLRKSFLHQTRLLAVALLATAVAAARAAEPEVLKQIPGDAYGVVVLNNPRTVAIKVSNAATRLQLPLPPDLLGSLTRSVGITAGFDANGSVALVLLKPGADRAGTAYFDAMPPAVLLVPTTNAGLLTEKFNPTKPDKDGISEVTLPQNPEVKYYITVVADKWVALAQKKEDLAAYIARGDSFSKTATAETLKVFEANDLVLWGNVEKLGAGVDKWLDTQHTNISGMRDLTNFINGGDALTSTLEKHGLNLVFDFGKRFFLDAGASMLTVRLTDSGATLGLITDFKAGSPMGKFVAAQAGGAGGVSLKGLPAGSFLVAGSGKWNSDAMAGVVGDVLNGIATDPALAKDARQPELKKSFDAVKQMMLLTNGMSFTMLEPPARGKDGYLNGAFLIDTSDPKKLLDLEIQSANNMLAQGMNPDLKMAVTVTPNALTVKDVPLAKMMVKISLRDETPDKPIPAASRQGFDMVQKLYGPNGLTTYMGVVGKRVLVIYGSELSLMESAITAAQADTNALGAMPEITATKDQVVANPVAVMYLPIVRWVTLAQAILAPGAAEPAPGAALANAPPVVMSLGVSGRMVTAELHVPIAAITATQDAVARLQRALQGPPDGVLPNLP